MTNQRLQVIGFFTLLGIAVFVVLMMFLPFFKIVALAAILAILFFVENLNGLIREYLPKKTDLDTITDEEIHRIQERLNNRPRKKLNYRSPNQAAAAFTNKLTGALNS